jgi:uracil-DNA glycosylase
MLLDDGARALDETKKDNDDFQRSIWITLGMTGRFYNEAKHLEDPSYGRWVLELQSSNSNENENENDNESNRHMIYYHDKRNFGTVKFCLSKSELEAKLKSLGPDVLALARQTANVRDLDDPSITIDDELAAQNADRIATTDFLQLLEKQRNPNINVCKLLMDQKKVAGVGNYILSEVLYRSDIDPFCGIDELSTSQRIKLFREIQAVCLESYLSQQESSKQGVGDGYTSVRNLEPFDFELCVYGNLGNCPKGTPVIRETNGPHGRTIWYTEDQLFVARHIREQRERKLREDLRSQKQAPQAPPKAPARDPWTITRRDGEDVFGESNNNSNAGDDSSDAIDEEEGSESTWNILDGLTEPGWKAALEPYVATSQSFASLQDFLEDEYSYYGREMIYPPPHQIFAALNLCPLDTVKVVILGQDPYHGPNQSTGLAFSVSKQISRIPPSLKNIFKELDDDVGRKMEKEPPQIRHGDLEGWAKQGVLMINTVLTVRRGQANSHQRKGWEDFTDQVVKILVSSETTEGGVVFLLWGGPASKKASSILTSPGGGGDSNNKHVVISTSHPSPLGATKTTSPFLTSSCFSRANAALAELGQDPIDWYER